MTSHFNWYTSTPGVAHYVMTSTFFFRFWLYCNTFDIARDETMMGSCNISRGRQSSLCHMATSPTKTLSIPVDIIAIHDSSVFLLLCHVCNKTLSSTEEIFSSYVAPKYHFLQPPVKAWYSQTKVAILRSREVSLSEQMGLNTNSL